MKRFGFGRKSEKSSPAPADNPYAQPASGDDPYAQETNKYANMTPYQQARANLANRKQFGLPDRPSPQNGNGFGATPNVKVNGWSTGGAESGGYGTPDLHPPPTATNGYGVDKYASTSGYGADKYSPTNGYGADKYSPTKGYGADKYSPTKGYGADNYSPTNGSGTDDYSPTSGYRADKYGASGGYGASRYTNEGRYGAGSRGPGGYGGLEPKNSTDTENTDTFSSGLLSGAKERYDTNQSRYAQNAAVGKEAGYRPDETDEEGYGGYGEARELTAEEQEEKAYQDLTSEIKRERQETHDTLDRSLAISDAIIAQASDQKLMLDNETESLLRTEDKMRQADLQNKVAENRVKELAHVQSMWSSFKPNIYGGKMDEKQEDRILRRNQEEREERERVRKEQYNATQQMEHDFKSMTIQESLSKTSKEQRSKYIIESSDEEDEDRLDHKMNMLSKNTTIINRLAVNMGRTVDEHNKIIDRIAQKSDIVDDQLKLNRARMGKIG